MILATPGLSEPVDGQRLMGRSSFGPGAWLLDAQARQDLGLYYAFCRAVDDCADEFPPAEARQHLAAWRTELDALQAGKPATAMGRALAELCARRGIPLALLDDLWQGARFDAVPSVRLQAYRHVRSYCYMVAGSVGLACLPIFGLDIQAAAPFARSLGEALQLINILRDAQEDAQRGRLYFARDDLKAHSVVEAAFLRGDGGAVAQALLKDYAGRARRSLAQADAALQGLDRRGTRAPRLMRDLYTALLDCMEADGLRVFEKRYRLSRPHKLWLVAKAMVLR